MKKKKKACLLGPEKKFTSVVHLGKVHPRVALLQSLALPSTSRLPSAALGAAPPSPTRPGPSSGGQGEKRPPTPAVAHPSPKRRYVVEEPAEQAEMVCKSIN